MVTRFNSEVLKLSQEASRLQVQIRQKMWESPEEFNKLTELLNRITLLRNDLLDTHATLAKHYSDIEFTPKGTLLIRIKYLTEGVEQLKKIPIGDWIDLRSAEEVTLSQGDTYSVPLGIAMELPKGYEAWLIGRSSLASKFKVIPTIGIGLIDNSYCGDNDEWKLPVYALQDTVIHKNDRICQFRIMEVMPPIRFEAVEFLGNPDRGGIGSTGVE